VFHEKTSSFSFVSLSTALQLPMVCEMTIRSTNAFLTPAQEALIYTEAFVGWSPVAYAPELRSVLVVERCVADRPNNCGGKLRATI
jgi:hypothetical protein